MGRIYWNQTKLVPQFYLWSISESRPISFDEFSSIFDFKVNMITFDITKMKFEMKNINLE